MKVYNIKSKNGVKITAANNIVAVPIQTTWNHLECACNYSDILTNYYQFY